MQAYSTMIFCNLSFGTLHRIALSTTNASQIPKASPGPVRTVCKALLDSSRVPRYGESSMTSTRVHSPSDTSMPLLPGKLHENGISSLRMQSCNKSSLRIKIQERMHHRRRNGSRFGHPLAKHRCEEWQPRRKDQGRIHFGGQML
jgi:hypothetical protein